MRRACLMLSAVVILGCSSDSQTVTLGPTDANVAGTYNMTAVNGHSLPVIGFFTADEEWDITSDQFVIGADATWTDTTNYLVTSLATGATRTTFSQSTGTYAIANGKINFTITMGNILFTGSVTGNTLSVLYSGGQFLYVR